VASMTISIASLADGGLRSSVTHVVRACAHHQAKRGVLFGRPADRARLSFARCGERLLLQRDEPRCASHRRQETSSEFAGADQQNAQCFFSGVAPPSS